jgi:hypothetical protein
MKPAERAAWDAAVDYYARNLADRDLLFDDAMTDLKAAVTARDLDRDALGKELRPVFEKALPVYERYFWPTHDRSNRAWTAETTSRMKALGPAVIPTLEKLYGTSWFSSPVRADVVWVGDRQGAYTTLHPPHAVISTSTTEWTSVEIVFHEFSHALVTSIREKIEQALGSRAKDHRALWHVVQFHLTGAAV